VGYTKYLDRHNASDLALTPKPNPTRNLQLSDVELKSERKLFPTKAVVEIDGKIANTALVR